MKYIALLLFFLAPGLEASTIEEISRRYLGQPYGNGALIVDQDLAASSYDCMTFVETVLAVYLSDSDAPRKLKDLRYFDGQQNEAMRKHFVETDWLPDNIALSYLKEATRTIDPQAPTINTLIDKQAWFHQVQPELAPAFEASKLPKKIEASLSFIPLDQIPQLLDRIPSDSIIVFIQKDPNKLLPIIKTPLIVGHMGFAVRVNNELLFRQADSNAKKISDKNFAKAMAESRRIFQGIAVYLPNFPHRKP